jgi:hypothetical protein
MNNKIMKKFISNKSKEIYENKEIIIKPKNRFNSLFINF